MNLKKYFDAANAAEARVQSIAAQIDEAFEAGKNEDALKLRPDLNKAKADATEAHELYIAMQVATVPNGDPGQRFVPTGGNLQVITDEADQKFESDGKFFMAVKNAALYPGRADPRLKSLWVRDATGLSEGVPADGGYLIPQEMQKGILERMYTTGEILSRISIDPVTGNNMSYNAVDETSRVDGSQMGGVTAYWVGEGGTITASKPKFRQIELKLKKVAALAYATDEQLEDVLTLESWLNRTVPNVLRFKVEDTIFEGDGVGKPLGILSSPCLIIIARDTAATIKAVDVVNMWSRRWAGNKDYVWLISQEAAAQLPQMTIASSPSWPVYVPPGGFADRPYGALFGAPVIETEYNAALNTKGDIMLASLSEYQAIDKGSLKGMTSIHVAFVTDETAFRFTYRIDGEPTWNSELTPLHGSNTVSPFVVLGSASAAA